LHLNTHLYRIVICFGLILICQIHAQSQSLEKIMADARHYKLSEKEKINNLEKLLENPRIICHPDTLGLLNYFIAFRYNGLFDYLNVIKYSSDAIEAFQQSNYTGYQYSTSLLLRAKSKLNLGRIEDATNDFDYIINEVPISGRGYQSLNEAYQKKSLIYRLRGEYESSIHNLNSFVTSNNIDSVNRYGKSISFVELSIAYAMLGGRSNLNLANEAVEKAVDFYSDDEILNDYHLEQKVLNIMQQAFIKRELEEFEFAIELYNNAVNLLRPKITTPKFNNLMIVSMINISQMMEESNNCEQALQIIKHAFNDFSQKSDSKYIETEFELFLTIADSYLCLGNNSKSQDYLKQSEALLLKSQTSKSALYLRQFVYKDFLIRNKIMQLNAQYKSDQDKSSLILLQSQTDFIDSLIGFYFEDMYFNASKVEIKNELDEFYKLALDISYQNNNLEKFWYYAEKRSNLLLLKNENRHSINNSELDTLEASLSKLKIQASDIENLIFSLNQKQSLIPDSLNTKLVDIKYSQLKLLERRSKFANYQAISVTTLPEFISNSDSLKSYISYQFGTQDLYALKISGSNVKLFNLGQASKIKTKIQNWFSAVSNRQDSQSEILQFKLDSEYLYKALIQPLGELSKDIILIPDEELYYLSYEALVTPDGNYVIENHNISYDLSGTFADQHRSQESTMISAVSVFLPSYKDSKYSDLVYSSNDYEALSDAKGLSVYEKDQTTKPNFISALQHADIVHFGGHAIHVDEDNQYSHLALLSSDTTVNNMVSLGDLYSLDITSKLIALPACNTGMGSILQGEGISNLTRGFFYGGTETVLSSLWDVDDKSTSVIMNYFYDNIKSGQSKSESLRQAKLNYLKAAPDFLKHPNLWSGLVLTGSSGQVSFAQRSFTRIGFLLLVGIIFMFFCLRILKN